MTLWRMLSLFSFHVSGVQFWSKKFCMSPMEIEVFKLIWKKNSNIPKNKIIQVFNFTLAVLIRSWAPMVSLLEHASILGSRCSLISGPRYLHVERKMFGACQLFFKKLSWLCAFLFYITLSSLHEVMCPRTFIPQRVFMFCERQREHSSFLSISRLFIQTCVLFQNYVGLYVVVIPSAVVFLL